MHFVITNSRTWIQGASPSQLGLFDLETKYPTALALAKERGFELEDGGNTSGWDGWIRFLHQPKTIPPWIPTGLFSRITRLCEKYKYPYTVEDKRERPLEGIPEGSPIPLRDYQEEAVSKAVNVGYGVVVMPPRSGKTRCGAEIHRRLSLPTLWIAPTDRIVQQTKEVLEDFFGPHYVEKLVGSSKVDPTKYEGCFDEESLEKKAVVQENLDRLKNKRIVVCTANTAARLPQEFYDSREILVIDEYHHAAAKSYHTGVFSKCDHIFFRFGLTGTFFRSGEDELSLHAYISDVIYEVKSRDLLKWGYLVPTHVLFLPVMSPKLRGLPARTFQSGHGKFGVQEHNDRNYLATWASAMLHQMGKRVLILVGTKKQGRTLAKSITPYVRPKNDGAKYSTVEFVSTDVPRYVQGEIMEAFLQSEEVQVLIGTSLLGEGVDLPTADALVYARGEKAEVSLTQNAYRTATSIPGKNYAVIVDFADRHHKKLMEHSYDRLSIYHAEPTFDIQVLRDPNELIGVLNAVDQKYVPR